MTSKWAMTRVWELFELSLDIKATQALCSEMWPLPFPLPAFLPRGLPLHLL